MAVGDLSFAFDPSKGETPQIVARKRMLAEAILGNTSHAPRDIGEGLNAVGQAIMYRKLMKDVTGQEQSGYSGAGKIFQSLMGANQFPDAPALSATPPASGAGVPSIMPQKSADNANAPSSMDFASAQSAPSADTGGGDIEAYIRRAASARGIDPDVAVTVANSEGGLKDPTRRSDYTKGGNREPSYGPFQLLVGGDGTGFPAGMGNQALAAGIDPRDPANWQKGVDFALDQASKKGWGQWYGAKAAGITGMHGIGQAPSQAPAVTATNAMAAGMLPPTAPVPMPNPMMAAAGAASVQVASLDPSAGMAQVPPGMVAPTSHPLPPEFASKGVTQAQWDAMNAPDAGAMPTSAPQAGTQPPLPVPGAIPPQSSGIPPAGPAGVDPSALVAAAAAQNDPGSPAPVVPPQVPAPQPQPGVDVGAPGAATPAGQRVLAAMMGGQSMTGAAPMGMQPGPAGAPAPQGGDAQQKVAQAINAGNGPDLSNLSPMAGGNAGVTPPGSQQQGPSLQQLMQASGDPWVMQRYGPVINAMLQQQMTPHKIDNVPLGNGVIAQIDSYTGRRIGTIQGAPSYTPVKDAAGNEYLVNPADPTHPIGPDQFAGGIPMGQGGGGAAPGLPQSAAGQPVGDPPQGAPASAATNTDPYASPFPRSIARTNEMKDYEGYLAQSRALNQPPMPFNDYQMELKKQGAQSVVFKGESAASQKVGEAVGGNMADYIDGAKDARSKLQALQLIKGVLDQNGDNISTGPGAQTMLSFKQTMANIFPSMGDAATPTEMLQKLSTQLATADAKGLASRPTQFDFATYLKNNPGIQMSIAGQKALVDLKLQQAKHDYELGAMATHKQYSEHPEDWADVVAQYDKDHPLINPLTGKPADPNMVQFPNAAPQAAIDALKQNPDKAGDFDQMFGAGSAAKILGTAPGAP